MKEATSLVIYYPNGSFQVVRPRGTFNGNFRALAEAIASSYYPVGVQVKYEVR
jgi:hypothetical protein